MKSISLPIDILFFIFSQHFVSDRFYGACARVNHQWYAIYWDAFAHVRRRNFTEYIVACLLELNHPSVLDRLCKRGETSLVTHIKALLPHWTGGGESDNLLISNHLLLVLAAEANLEKVFNLLLESGKTAPTAFENHTVNALVSFNRPKMLRSFLCHLKEDVSLQRYLADKNAPVYQLASRRMTPDCLQVLLEKDENREHIASILVECIYHGIVSGPICLYAYYDCTFKWLLCTYRDKYADLCKASMCRNFQMTREWRNYEAMYFFLLICPFVVTEEELMRILDQIQRAFFVHGFHPHIEPTRENVMKKIKEILEKNKKWVSK